MWRATVALALLSRLALVGLPHSGAGAPPVFGDFEAHRHWSAVTAHLPLGEWYRGEHPDNDLLYWGLDYPPLAAYASSAIGTVARSVLPELVALGPAAHGFDSLAGKLFMRGTVILGDALTLLPGALLVAHALTRGGGSAAPIALAMLLHPALLIVDHGHFQYNGVALGLILLACAAATGGGTAALSRVPRRGSPASGASADAPAPLPRLLLAALALACAVNFKHTLLAFAPALAIFLLASALAPRYQRSSGGMGWCSVAVRMCAIGGVGLGATCFLWLPFCLFSLDGCAAGLRAVAVRLAPLDRGVFEDKVANLWCAAEPVLHLRERLFALGHGAPSGLHFAIAALCAAVVIALATPSLVLLWHRIVLAAPLDEGVAVTLQRKPGSTLPPASGGHPYLISHLLLSLTATSLAVFLAAFQVHEKAILLPALPLAALALGHTSKGGNARAGAIPLLGIAFAPAATWTLWPLLARDGLLLPATCLVALYLSGCFAAIMSVTPRAGAWARFMAALDVEATHVAVGVRLLGLSRVATNARVRMALASFFTLAALSAAAISAAAASLAPPASLPDLYPYLTAVWGATFFSAALAHATLVQLAWTADALVACRSTAPPPAAGASGGDAKAGGGEREGWVRARPPTPFRKAGRPSSAAVPRRRRGSTVGDPQN